MPNREQHPQARPVLAAITGPGLADLISLNPHLTLADILALWHWTGPSSQVH